MIKHTLVLFGFVSGVLLAAAPAVAAPGASHAFGEKDWSGINDMTALGDKLYVATALGVLEVDKKGNARTLAIRDPAFGRATSITVLDGKLYCVSEEILWQVGLDGKVKNLGPEWFSVPGMAGLDGKLYIVADEKLYEVNAETGKYVKLSEDWYNVDGVVAQGGKLYIVSRDHLYEVDTLGNRKELAGNWNDPNAVVAFGGKLYIFHHEPTPGGRLNNEFVLYEVDTAGNGKKLALPKGWDVSTGTTAMAALDGKLYLFMPGMSRSQFFSLDSSCVANARGASA